MFIDSDSVRGEEQRALKGKQIGYTAMKGRAEGGRKESRGGETRRERE